MRKEELIELIMKKKEFSQLPKRDVEIAFGKFDKPGFLDEEKIKLTRDLLRKSFSGFAAQKTLTQNPGRLLKNKSTEEILKKHLSTRERLLFYPEIYNRLLNAFKGRKISIIDLGAGINGLSYAYFVRGGFKVDYVAVEAVRQLDDLMNCYFKENRCSGKALHLSLFELEKIKKIIRGMKRPRVVFLFKTLDSLEMLKKDFSKELLLEIAPIADLVAVSFATRSMIKRKKFYAKRSWIFNFVRENFKILDDFEIAGEKYLVFGKK